MSVGQILGGNVFAPGQTTGQQVGGIVGAAIGAFVGGPAGAFTGYSIGAQIPGMNEPAPHQEPNHLAEEASHA